MNVGPSECLDILLWLDRYTLSLLVAQSCQLFKQVIDAHTAALPLFHISQLTLEYDDKQEWDVTLSIIQVPFG